MGPQPWAQRRSAFSRFFAVLRVGCLGRGPPGLLSEAEAPRSPTGVACNFSECGLLRSRLRLRGPGDVPAVSKR